MKMPNDFHLWERVKRTVTPLHEKPFVTECREKLSRGWDWLVRPEAWEHEPVQTLPDFPVHKCLDLHGMTIQQAHEEAVAYVRDAYWEGAREVTIVTGRSGDIRREFPTWMRLHERVRSFDTINGDGAFKVRIKPRPAS